MVMKINSEDINVLLEEMHDVDISHLNKRATKLFYAIMQIADERDLLRTKYNKALELLLNYNMPCEIDGFNTKEENIEYCSRNCSVDDEVFIKCWDRFIEQELKK